MKRLILFTLALICAHAPAGAQTSTSPPAAAPTTPTAAAPAPGARVEAAKFLPEEVAGRELKDLGGRPFRLSDYGGRVYVLNLWATWCGPCRLEIPGFNKVYEEFKGRGVEFVGLTTEDPSADAERVRTFVSEVPVKYRVGWLDRAAAEALAAFGASSTSRPGSFPLPQTYVIAPDGHIVLRVRGYNPRVPEMIRNGVQTALALSQKAPDAGAGANAPAATPAAPAARATPAATPAAQPPRP
jgi:thiol-disulfide isomerase/thioredoxin